MTKRVGLHLHRHHCLRQHIIPEKEIGMIRHDVWSRIITTLDWKRYMYKLTVMVLLLLGCSIHWLSFKVEANKNDYTHLPGAFLLMGYPPYNLILTTSNNTLTIQESKTRASIYPSMSQNGMIIASAQTKGSEPYPKLVVATYS